MIGIYGASGFGREIMPFAGEGACFVDDGLAGSQIGAHPVLSLEAFAEQSGGKGAIIIAVADPAIRRQLASRCEERGLTFARLHAPQAVRGERCHIGEGAIFCPFTQITSDITIGTHFHANLFSYVAHDCEIGDFVTFAPSVCCNGNVTIGDGTYIGTAAIIRQGTPERKLRIGEGAIVGAGAVVLKDVPDGATIVGNPGRVLAK